MNTSIPATAEAPITPQPTRSEYGGAKEALLGEFAATLGCLHTPGRDTLHLHTQSHGVTGTIRVGTPNRIYFTLDGLSPKKARWIVALLKKLIPTQVRSNPATCPLCTQPNGCQFSTESHADPCWCRAETFPPELTARTHTFPSCICLGCVKDSVSQPLPRLYEVPLW